MSRTWHTIFKGIRKELFRKILYLDFFSNHKDTAQLRILVKVLLLKHNIRLYGNFLKFYAKFLWNNSYKNCTILSNAFELKKYVLGFESLYIDILYPSLWKPESSNNIFDTPSNFWKNYKSVPYVTQCLEIAQFLYFFKNIS